LVARSLRSLGCPAGQRWRAQLPTEPVRIEETDTAFSIGWKGSYRLDGPAFVYSDRETGRVVTVLGYPTDKIADTA
jgi:hypothetical protein